MADNFTWGAEVPLASSESGGVHTLKMILAAGAAAIGKLAANDGVDIGDVGIAREYTTATLTMADNVAITDAANCSAHAGGTVHVPAGWITANLGFSRATTLAGTYTRMRDQTGTLLQITGIVADQVYPLPTELFGCGFIKLLSQDASGNNTNQTGGPLSFVIELKS